MYMSCTPGMGLWNTRTPYITLVISAGLDTLVLILVDAKKKAYVLDLAHEVKRRRMKELRPGFPVVHLEPAFNQIFTLVRP